MHPATGGLTSVRPWLTVALADQQLDDGIWAGFKQGKRHLQATRPLWQSNSPFNFTRTHTKQPMSEGSETPMRMAA